MLIELSLFSKKCERFASTRLHLCVCSQAFYGITYNTWEVAGQTCLMFVGVNNINVGGFGQGEGWAVRPTFMFEGVTDLNVGQCILCKSETDLCTF